VETETRSEEREARETARQRKRAVDALIGDLQRRRMSLVHFADSADALGWIDREISRLQTGAL